MTKLRFIGLDVHAETIAVAVAEPGGEIRALGRIPNRPESVRKLIAKLGPVKELRACYEAGPPGYVLYWQLVTLGVDCQVVAPTLVPVKAGDRVKTDRRGCRKTAALSSGRGPDGSLGSRRGARSVARSGPRARSGQEGPAPGAAQAQQVSASTRLSPAQRHEGVDPNLPGMGEEQGAF